MASSDGNDDETGKPPGDEEKMTEVEQTIPHAVSISHSNDVKEELQGYPARPNALQRVVPSFGMSMQDVGDDASHEEKTNPDDSLQQQAEERQNNFLTQNVEDDDSEDSDSGSDVSRNYASDEDDDVEDEDEDDSGDDTASDEESTKFPAKKPIQFDAKGREERRQRNKGEQVRLGLGVLSPKRKTVNKELLLTPPPSEPPTPRPQYQPVRGMVFCTPYNSSSRSSISQPANKSSMHDDENDEDDEAAMLEELADLYPHRQAQIQQLWSVLSPALPPTSTTNNIYNATTTSTTTATTTKNIPPPVFVTGPAGTGKTSIVRDIVTRLKHSRSLAAATSVPHPHRVGSAYINCATLDMTRGSPMDEILHEAYRQLAQDMKAGRNFNPWRRRRKRKRKTQKSSPKSVTFLAPSAKEADDNTSSSNPSKKQRVVQDGENVNKDLDSNISSEAEGIHKSKGESQEASGAPYAADTSQQTSSAKDTVAAPSDPPATEVGDKAKESGKSSMEVEEDGGNESPLPRRSRRVSDLDRTGHADANGTSKDNTKANRLMSAISSDLDATATAAARDGDLTASATSVSRTAYIAAATFGQEIKETLFSHANDCAFLVLDQAEQLLSFPSSSKTNYLAQLLLLPRTKGLNLTIVVITKSTVLEHSRFNNLVIPEKSLSTISSALQPLHIRFQSYKGKESIKQILSRPSLLERIIGPTMLSSCMSGDDKFVQQVVKSFLNTLVQTLYGSTRDLKEIVRLGRLLWPLYVKPLHSTNLEKTMKSVQKMMPSSKASVATTESSGKHIQSFLDQQILPQMRLKLEHCMYSFMDQEETQYSSSAVPPKGTGLGRASAPNTTTPNNPTQQLQTVDQQKNPQSMAYLSKCLMLAGFICQTNRADKDRQLFTIQKNGRKKSGKKSPNEDLAFGSSRNGASKGYRPRMFPMERMLSVFVSIVGLNQGHCSKKTSQQTFISTSSIGSSDFFEALAHLRDIGVLYDKPGRGSSATETANLAAPKFWCSLTKDEADCVAKSVLFPLDDYLL